MGKSKSICILGITGSIGTQTVKVAKQLGYKIVGCSFHANKVLGRKLVKANNIKYFYCSSDQFIGNCCGFDDLIKKSKPDIVVNAIVGFAGLKGTLAALKNNVDLALANKESVVTAGWYIFKYSKQHNIRVLPIDSEHTNLYFQVLNEKPNTINQIYITGSGGKYFGKSNKNVTYAEAIKHKNWLMGNKITIDSNTLMNKCFEVVEAHWYFKTHRINVLLDKTSNIHSAIMLNDGEFKYSFSEPNMVEPIKMVLSNFKYVPNAKTKLNLTNTLVRIDHLFPINWAYKIMQDKTNSLGVLINAANEVAIKLFQAKILRFDQIVPYIENSMKKIKLKNIKNVEQIYEFDKFVRLASIKYWK